MEPLVILSAVEQAAAHLRAEISSGSLSGSMPGVNPLAAELGVSRKTVNAALDQLEREGLLIRRGAGRCREIAPPDDASPPALRVGILVYDQADKQADYVVQIVHELEKRGHRAVLAASTLNDLGMKVPRIARFVAKHPADAWLVVAGSREVLEWFADAEVPAFALFGRQPSVRIGGTGPLKSPSIAAVVRRLVALGHRRIVMLAREERRKPEPGRVERVFLDTLREQGVPVGDYNLPDWKDNPKDLQRCLASLFARTPPSALIAAVPHLFAATPQFLQHRGIRVPQDISLVCGEPDPNFLWCVPHVAHIDFDNRPLVRNIVKWVGKVAGGENDRRQLPCPAKFIEGGTIGPAPT